MKEEISRAHLEIIVNEIKRIEIEHPKANVTYDFVGKRINITYPLPKDFYQMQNIKSIN